PTRDWRRSVLDATAGYEDIGGVEGKVRHRDHGAPRATARSVRSRRSDAPRRGPKRRGSRYEKPMSSSATTNLARRFALPDLLLLMLEVAMIAGPLIAFFT